MSKEDKNTSEDYFNEIIGKKLKNYSLPTNENSWKKIETRLYKKDRNKIILQRSIAILATAVCITLIWLIFPFNRQTSPYYGQTAELTPDKNFINENILSSQTTVDPSDSVALKQSGSSSKTHYSSPKRNTFIQQKIEKNFPTPTSEELNLPNLLAEHSNEEMTNKKEVVSEAQVTQSATQEKHYLFISKNKSPKKSLGLYGGSSTGNLLAINDRKSQLQYNNNSLRGNQVSSNSEEVLEKDESTARKFTDVSHYLPLSFGVNIRKGLNKNFSIETGIIYTYLYSKFKNNVPQEELQQSLHYIGIPLNISGKLYSNATAGLNIYVSAGGTMEKGISANYNHTFYHDNKSSSTKSHKNIKGLQWSLNAAIGLDYTIKRSYSIFIEPKISYYLHNNQPLSSRTENPFTVGVNAGIRYTW